MPQEVELKLRLSPADARRLQNHPALADAAAQTYSLYNTYYDTPERSLLARGVALRLRRKGHSEWLMTVKGRSERAGGLSQRNEWEAATEPGRFDFGIVSDDALRDFLEAQRPRLAAVFTTDFTRVAWQLDRPGARIEFALDQGSIAAGDAASQPICEVELELVAGDSPDALFDLAIELAGTLRLHSEIASKASRGFALADGSPARPGKAAPSPLTAAMSPVEAFRDIALACLEHLQRNEAGTVAGQDAEYLHQARVAIRRLRSALDLFEPVLPSAFINVYAPRWRKVARQLGGARDWDVFLAETLAPLEAAFPGDAALARIRSRGQASQARARRSAARALSRNDYSRLLLAFSAGLFRLPAAAGRAGEAPELLPFARQRLRERARKVAKLARLNNGPGKMTPSRRHRLRIRFKKLRYALEFFAPLLSSRNLPAYQAALAEIQDLLGRLNDLVSASRLVRKAHPRGKASRLVNGWIAGRGDILIEDFQRRLDAFLAQDKPWRKSAISGHDDTPAASGQSTA